MFGHVIMLSLLVLLGASSSVKQDLFFFLKIKRTEKQTWSGFERFTKLCKRNKQKQIFVKIECNYYY